MDIKQRKHVLIMGAGAVGGYIGAKIFQNGAADVTLVARGDHFKAIQKHGLMVSTSEDESALPVPVVDRPETITVPPDLIIIAVKTKDTEQAVSRIKPIISPNTQVLTIQNGLGNYDYVSNELGKEQVIRGFCRIGTEIVSPGHIHYSSMGDITIGEEDGSNSERCDMVQSIFTNAGIACEIADNILKRSWRKMIWNTVFNCLSGLTLTTLDAIYQTSQAHRLALDLAGELQQIARADNVEFSDEEITRLIENSARLGQFRTSTYQDRLKNKPLEYDAFCGYACRKAEQHGLQVPKLQTIDALFRLHDQQHPAQ